MKNKSVIYVFAILMCFVCSFNFVSAHEILNYDVSKEVYKLSEDTSDTSLPIIRCASERIELDKSIKQDGLYVSKSSISITQPIEGIQVLNAGDTVRIDADSEYLIIFTTGNLIINGTIDKNIIAYCGGNTTINEGADIKGNLVIYTSKLDINSNISGNIMSYTPILNLNGNVSGQLRTKSYLVNVKEGINVEKSFLINTTNPDLKVENADIDYINRTPISQKEKVKYYIIDLLRVIVIDFVTYAMIIFIFKKDKVSSFTNKIIGNKKTIFNGFLVFAVLSLLSFIGLFLILFLRNIGVAVVLTSLSFLLVVSCLRVVLMIIVFTEVLYQKYNNNKYKLTRFSIATLVTILIELIRTIPFIGSVIDMLMFILSLGLLYNLILPKKTK